MTSSKSASVCVGKTSKGTRCTRKVVNYSTNKVLCYQHRDQDKDDSCNTANQTLNNKTNDCRDGWTGDNCSICMDDEITTWENDAQLKCGHKFHLDCIRKVCNDACPICRLPLESDRLTRKDKNKIAKAQREFKHEIENDFDIPLEYLNIAFEYLAFYIDAAEPAMESFRLV